MPVAAYRGAGRPEGNYFMERLVEAAAASSASTASSCAGAITCARRRSPTRPPRKTTYDSGDFTNLLEHAFEAADWAGFETRKAESRARGKLRGRGIGNYLEVTAPPQKEMGGIRFESDGTVTIITGTLDYGQGHASPFAQVLTSKLGIPFERIRLLQGDSDELIAGGGTGGSKSIMASGAAILEAERQGDRERQADRLRRAGGGGRAISSSRAGASPSRAPTAPSGSWSSRRSCAPD